MKIRKQVYELTLQDLKRFPVWEFALDEKGEEGQDEATVRPVKIAGALDPSDGQYVVRAEFKLADGSKMQGCLTPTRQGKESLSTIQPVIITDKGCVGFWCGVIAPDARRLAESYRKLGRDPAKVFPIQVASGVQLVRGPISTMIPGFMVLEDFKTGRTRIVS